MWVTGHITGGFPWYCNKTQMGQFEKRIRYLGVKSTFVCIEVKDRLCISNVNFIPL